MVKTTKNKKSYKKLNKNSNRLNNKSKTLKKKTFRKKAGFSLNKKRENYENLENTLIRLNSTNNQKFLEEKAKPPTERNLDFLKLILKNIQSNNEKLSNIFYNGKSQFASLETVNIKGIQKTIKETEKVQPKSVSPDLTKKAKKPEQLAPLPSCWKQVFDKDFNRSYVRSDGLKADKNNRPPPDAECP